MLFFYTTREHQISGSDIVSGGRETKPEDMALCLGAHGDFSFPVWILHTDLFTPMKVMGLFNIHSLEVIILII